MRLDGKPEHGINTNASHIALNIWDTKMFDHMIHENGFGEFEEKFAGGVYLADVWMTWLDTFSDVQNQFACFLCIISNLMEMCKFLLAGSALARIHVTVPFMSMLLDHKVTPR